MNSGPVPPACLSLSLIAAVHFCGAESSVNYQ